MKIIAFFALMILAGPAVAQSWSPLTISSNKGGNVSNYTPDTDADSPTLQTSTCASISIACVGTTLTGTLQLCTSADAASCSNYLVNPLRCGGTYGVTGVKAAWIRLDEITNSDSSQLFHVICK